jgi:hypothetical protein
MSTLLERTGDMMSVMDPAERVESLEAGMRVEVRRRFDQRWARGFEIAEVVDDGGYRVRRLSDGEQLPTVFGPDDVRRERRRNSMWWY